MMYRVAFAYVPVVALVALAIVAVVFDNIPIAAGALVSVILVVPKVSVKGSISRSDDD